MGSKLKNSYNILTVLEYSKTYKVVRGNSKEHAEDLCYFPTQGLCSLKGKLDESYFPKNQKNIFRQELVTYEMTDIGVKRTTHVRNFSGVTHYDSRTSEFLKGSA